ncbi:universal stress protein [Natrialba sp. PRR66]|uniref:universal stress protein n=1 Tax=Natrialba sp. PRR66 TaxID=3098146 RepID=UPI002B1D1CED|nr:universal stress protein [Natrialba sp. PRR66]
MTREHVGDGRILVAYDGSEPATAALEFALETFPDAAITALYVIPIAETTVEPLEGPELRLPVTEQAREYATDLLEEATALAASADRELETEVAAGKPERRIVDRAADEGYETVVIGSHGREGVSRVLLGSVAESVVRRSPVPVAVVR